MKFLDLSIGSLIRSKSRLSVMYTMNYGDICPAYNFE